MSVIIKSCESCGKSVKRYPYEFMKRCFCSRKCYAIGNKTTNNHNWKGGRIQMKSGYILVYQPSHPNADKNGYMLEHRLVMEKKLGRYLAKGEIIHHVNHTPDDNNEANLILLNEKSHLSLHRLDGTITNKGAEYKHGRWASHYDCCIYCGRNDRKYNAKGLCMACYQLQRSKKRRLENGK